MRSWTRPAAVFLCASIAQALATAPQQPDQRPRVTGIHHVALRVSDVGAAHRFYGGILGLTGGAPAADGRVTFDIGSRQRVVLLPGLPPAEDERLGHLAFETPDIALLRAHLTARGYTVQPADGCHQGAIRTADPDGHPVEFVPARWPPAPAAPAGRALSTRLLHAGLTIRDETAAHAFYREALGFAEIWRGGRKEGITQWVNMRVPDGTDYLEYMLVTSAPDRRQRGVLHHLCLQVPDIQAAWEETVRRVSDSERMSIARPQVGVNGRWQLNLFDPDGTRTELMEPFRIR